MFNLEGQTKGTRSRAVKNVRRHACCVLVKACKQYPKLLLVRVFITGLIFSSKIPSIDIPQLICEVKHIDGLVQERCNSTALAVELHLSCTNLSISIVTSKSGLCFNFFALMMHAFLCYIGTRLVCSNGPFSLGTTATSVCFS